MSVLFSVLMLIIPFVAIFAAIYAALKCVKKGKTPSKAMKVHFMTLVSVFALLTLCTFGASAETAETATAAASSASDGLRYIAAALCTGIASVGGGIALAAGIPAAIGATAEDPKAFGKALIFVALGETLALYGVIISFMILSN